jgi:hypothetical protein
VHRSIGLSLWDLRCDRNPFGHGPHEPYPLPSNGHHDLIGVLPPGHESSEALTKPELGLPADVLDGFGLGFQSQLEMATDFRRIAVRPGAFDQRPAGMGVTGFGDRPLSASLAGGILRGDQPQEFHQFSGVVEAGKVTDLSDRRDGHDKLHATQGLEGLDHRAEAPGLNLFLKFLFQALQAFDVVGDRADLCLKDDLLSRCLTDHSTQPPQVSWAPCGAVCIADSAPE